MAENLTPHERIVDCIYLVRSQKVILDSDLARLYGVETRVLVQAVKRNKDRFPADFMFQLDRKEFNLLRSQIVTSSSSGGRQYLPYAFTEQGVAMLSGVLRSEQAVSVNIAIMRAFVEMRRLAERHKDLASRVDALEQKYDTQLQEIYRILKSMIVAPDKSKRQIGFKKD